VEAVENHMPEIIMVDEIGTEAEALACRTIAERGVQLVATAHGQLLENLIKNPTLSDLVGGIQSVTLGMTPHAKCTTHSRVAACVGTRWPLQATAKEGSAFPLEISVLSCMQ